MIISESIFSNIRVNILYPDINLLATSMLVVFIFFSSASEAREWYVEPSVKIRSEYDDNIQLDSDEKNPDDVYGVIASARSRFGVRSEAMDVAAGARVDVKRYTEDENDTENFYFDLDSNINVTERNQFNLDGKFVMDTNLTSEEVDTGITQVQVDRDLNEITPGWTYFLTELQSVNASYTHKEVDYEDVTRFDNTGNKREDNLTDYRSDSVSLNYAHQWQPDTRYFITLTALMSDVSDHVEKAVNIIDEEVENYSLQIGFDHQFSKTWKGSFMVGGRWTEDDFKEIPVSGMGMLQNEKNNKLGVLFALNMRKQFESGFIKGEVAQNARQTGSGDFKEIFHFELSAGYRLSPRLRAAIKSGIYLTSTAVNNDDISDRTYYKVEPRLSWFFNPQTSLTGGYRFRRQEFDKSRNTADSNNFFLYFNYQWDKISTSRF